MTSGPVLISLGVIGAVCHDFVFLSTDFHLTPVQVLSRLSIRASVILQYIKYKILCVVK